ncbi:hypothetical protein WICPIJ_003648 [Wickerhamomyces pijperi]|uniref:AMP-dependent synthetase/ligase domain-containing protein n=1 Tax=Wickerhamomyces pijperi TaxID=599730 RepID=A0A9P8Q772_WICPI|nr:hypothetical protein WICPIJ_003648 [Wickerhamomyces pijperi]
MQLVQDSAIALYILSLTEAKIVFTVNENIAKLVELISSHSLPVSVIVTMDSILEKHQQLCDSQNIDLTTIPASIKKGKDTPSPVSPQTPESTATITFTSGTSAQPKGVPLAQANIVTALSYVASILPSEIMLHKGRARFYAMLPFGHIMERADV